jgi:hypothetical protein
MTYEYNVGGRKAHRIVLSSANGTIKGSITGVRMRTPMQKVWRVSQAVGDIAFSYPYSLILLEIQVHQRIAARAPVLLETLPANQSG